MVKQKTRNIGIEAKPPEGVCEDLKCPWHGTLPVRKLVLKGVVESAKASKTVIVRWDYHNYMTKYERYERRNGRVAAYCPLCISAKKGDTVRIAECRPLSKTKKFVVIEVVK
ncbi:MAG: 30S ribosomal protein S17 [Candidatus Aenigmarchaeota archaeon]|nr:30S ribosomal protein S17 [Candidatus Aenigmarchaeota archaeon]